MISIPIYAFLLYVHYLFAPDSIDGLLGSFGSALYTIVALLFSMGVTKTAFVEDGVGAGMFATFFMYLVLFVLVPLLWSFNW